MKSHRERNACYSEPDWEFFLPDDEEIYPEEGDFWMDEDDWPEE